MSAISLHQFLAHIDFRQIAYIESVSSQATSGDASLDAPVSSIAFIGASTLLTAQPLEYFRTLARGQMLPVAGPDGTAGAQERLVCSRNAVRETRATRPRQPAHAISASFASPRTFRRRPR